MAMAKKYSLDEVFKIKDADGNEKWAKIVFRGDKPPRLKIVTRASNRGRYSQTPIELTIPAFRKLLVT